MNIENRSFFSNAINNSNWMKLCLLLVIFVLRYKVLVTRLTYLNNCHHQYSSITKDSFPSKKSLSFFHTSFLKKKIRRFRKRRASASLHHHVCFFQLPVWLVLFTELEHDHWPESQEAFFSIRNGFFPTWLDFRNLSRKNSMILRIVHS